MFLNSSVDVLLTNVLQLKSPVMSTNVIASDHRSVNPNADLRNAFVVESQIQL